LTKPTDTEKFNIHFFYLYIFIYSTVGYEIFIHSEIKNKKNQNTAENRSQTKIKHKSVSVFGAQLAVCSAAKFVHKTQINRALTTLKSTELSQLSPQQSPQLSHQLYHHQSSLFLEGLNVKDTLHSESNANDITAS
jgi:hypothetical protein